MEVLRVIPDKVSLNDVDRVFEAWVHSQASIRPIGIFLKDPDGDYSSTSFTVEEARLLAAHLMRLAHRAEEMQINEEDDIREAKLEVLRRMKKEVEKIDNDLAIGEQYPDEGTWNDAIGLIQDLIKRLVKEVNAG